MALPPPTCRRGFDPELGRSGIYWASPVASQKRLMEETFGDPSQLPDLVLKIRVEKASKHWWAKYERGRYHKVIERKELAT